MTINRSVIALSAFAIVCAALSAQAADRMRPGQWVGTTIAGGKTYPNSSCISQSEADAMNGDATAVARQLQTVIPPEICKITDVTVDATRIVYTASCVGAAAKVVTTSYHGDSSEGTDTTGTKTTAKLVGPCK